METVAAVLGVEVAVMAEEAKVDKVMEEVVADMAAEEVLLARRQGAMAETWGVAATVTA